MVLKKNFTFDAVRCADQRTGSAHDVRHDSGGHDLEIVRQVRFGDRLTVSGVRPQRLVGIGDRNAHDAHLSILTASRA